MSGLLELWPGLAFDDPVALAALVMLPVAWLLGRWRGVPALRFAPAWFLGGAGRRRSWRARLWWLPDVLEVLAVAAVALALARPVERVELPRETEGVDVLLCLDVSSSMSANDLDPARTRLGVAKDAASRFVAGRPDDRIGLVRFARYPDLLCPPTLDHDALQRFLAGVELVEADGAEDQTGIGTAVARAAAALRETDAKSKIVILLTDGEENVATVDRPDEIGPALAGRICEELGVRVYAIAAGIGKRAPDGSQVPLDTGPIEELAGVTGGRFFAARDAGAVDAVYAAIDELERAPFAEPRFELRDRFLPFVVGALALLLLGVALRTTVLGVAP